MDELCHCGEVGGYEGCCGLIHSGAREAATAEQLMRARYSAHVEDDLEFLQRSWHPAHRPPEIAQLPDHEWLGLRVEGTDRGGQLDSTGTVSFVAQLRTAGGVSELQETSEFGRIGGRWVYLEAVGQTD